MMSLALQNIHLFLTEHPLLAPILYMVSHVIFTLFLIPCTPMAVIAGVLWGKWLGLGVSIGSALLSSSATFCLSHFFLKDKIYAFMSTRYTKIDWFLAQTKKYGWKFVAMVQLNPVALSSSLGYLFGLTDIAFFVYAVSLLIFMLPLQVLLVICGDSLFELLQGELPWLFLVTIGILLGYLGFGLRNEHKQ